MTECPNCSANVPAGVDECPKCTADIDRCSCGAADWATNNDDENGDTRHCNSCGQAPDDDDDDDDDQKATG